MRGYRYWGMISLLGAGLALTLAGCGGGSGGGGGTPAVGSDASYTSSAVVTTLAGSGSIGSTNGPKGTNATFSSPTGLALNSVGNYLYVADTGNSVIRMIYVPGDDHVVDTFYSGSLSGPEALTFSGTNLYVCDTKSSAIRTLSSSASVGVFVNSGLNYPTGIVLYNSSFYVADSKNNVIKQIDSSTKIVTATYGSGSVGYTGCSYDSPTVSATTADFNTPYGVASDNNGNIYVTDSVNSTIRKIDVTGGTVTILAGLHGTTTPISDSTGANGSTATFNKPTGIAFYQGYLYVADTGNHIIRKVNASTGVVTTIAGYKGYAGFYDGKGNATKFSSPTGIVSDGAGTLYVADKGNHRIRKIVL